MPDPEAPDGPDPAPEEDDAAAVPMDDKEFWHDGYEPIRRRRDDEPTDAHWPVPKKGG
ncbi:MAG TPA: hypothetical protein RMH99_13860 [Sandaracinaceae bacterium LLY-WYZ-13_1]|nr:hypothetical protein [Sandaracinaceae bacterium LLY-WYZ-13_1]